MKQLSVLSLSLIITTASIGVVRAADDKSTGVSDLTNKFRVDLGSLVSLSKGGKSSTYYNIQFDGNSLFAHGTAPSADDPLLTYGATKPKDSKSNPLSFRLEKREPGNTDGDMNFLASKKLFLPKGLPLQGALDFATRTNMRQVNVAGGLETTAFHPVAFLNHMFDSKQASPLSVANWAHIGLMTESQSRPAAEGGNQDTLGASYRFFAGTGFGATNKRRYHLKEIRKFYEKSGVFDYDTLIANLTKAKKLESGTSASFANLVSKINLILNVGDPTLPANRNKVVDQFSQSDPSIAASEPDDDGVRPIYKFEATLLKKNAAGKSRLEYNVTSPLKYQLYVESAGRYYMTGHFATSRWQPLTAVTLKYILNPQKDPDGAWIALRFQNGRERSTPTVYKNFLMGTAGFTF